MPEGRREIPTEPVPADLEAMLPPVSEHVPDEPPQSCTVCARMFDADKIAGHECVPMEVEPVVRPCKVCGVSLEGEHPRRETCKPCQVVKARVATEAHAERVKDLPPEELPSALSFEMPELVIVEGVNPDITGWVVSIYKLLKHHFGLSKNGITEVLGQFRRGVPRGEVVDLYAEMLKSMASLDFAEDAIKVGLICDALEKCLGKDINLKWGAF